MKAETGTGKTNYNKNVSDRIEERIPSEIIQSLAKHGWNIFGIYEVVHEEIENDKRKKIRQRMENEGFDDRDGLVGMH